MNFFRHITNVAGAICMSMVWSGTICQASDDIQIGVAGPLTGAFAAFGDQLRRGADMAVADINAAGGIDGRLLKITLGDDAADERQAVSVANRFVANGIHFVIGHLSSGASIAASDTYADNDVLQISPASTSPLFTDRGFWNTFRTCGRDDQQSLVAADHIAAHFKSRSVAVLHDRTPYGKGLADTIAMFLEAKSVRVTVKDGINLGDRDFSALVTKLKQNQVDFVYFAGGVAEAGLLLRQMHDSDLKVTFMGGDGIATGEFAAIAGQAAMGVLMTFAPDPRTSAAATAVVGRFRNQGFEPEAYTLYAYAAIEVLAVTMRKALSAEPKTIAEMLHNEGPFPTVIGDIAFDSKGDLSGSTYTVYKWERADDNQIRYFPQRP